MRLIVLCLLAGLTAATATDYGPRWTPRNTADLSPFPRIGIDWSKEIIYFILIDRFCNGDVTNDAGNNPHSHQLYDPARGNIEALKTYQGGDLSGVLQKLDYLDSLGVTTLWLSPVFDNADEDFLGWWPYHGYFPVDFFAVDEHFGDLALLREVVKQAHERGMKVLLDMIYNHAAPSHPWVAQKEFWEDQGYRRWFHPRSGVDAATSISDWQDQHQLENFELSGLPDWDQENPHVYEFMLDYSKFWIQETNCDGFRLDAVKHVPRTFWKKLCSDLHRFAGDDFLLLGEVFAGEVDYVSSYQDLGFNALFDIPLYYTTQRVFAQGSPIPLLSDILAANDSSYRQILLSPLLDNHDVARFSYYAAENVEQKIKSALTFLWALNGLPMLYYGTEAALPGAAPQNEQTGAGQDYLNRLMMPWQGLENSELVAFIRRLNGARKQCSALQKGRIYEIYRDYGFYVFLKYDEHDARLAAINNSGYPERRRLFLDPNIFPPNGVYRDELADLFFRANGDTLEMELPEFGACYLTAENKIITDVLSAQMRRCPFTPRRTRDYQAVCFTFSGNQNLQSVAVAGDFNGWSATANRLQREGELWRIELPLKPGRYRYKFVLNGVEWIADPAASEFDLDPYGGRNSIRQVEKER